MNVSDNKIVNYIKREVVLVVAIVLAVVSMFFVTPDKKYIDYIDFRTLGILFCLMVVMEGLKNINVFQLLAQKILQRVKNLWQLVVVLTMLCFFFSMFITNDVALITFVPLTLILLNILGDKIKKRIMIPVVVMQTVAANLGSMLTPIGNPQNLYLYSQAEMSINEFVLLMLPYTTIAFVIIILWSVLVCKGIKGDAIKIDEEQVVVSSQTKLILHMVLFALCLLTVAHIVPYEAVVVVVLISVLLWDRSILIKIDYSLLLTFIVFFIFVGNVGRITVFSKFLESIINGNEIITSVLSSQVISNVPAALLLSGFTNNYEALIVGTNMGGLGTLIASMASLISYKYVVKEESNEKGKYLIYFTIFNIIILLLMLMFSYII